MLPRAGGMLDGLDIGGRARDVLTTAGGTTRVLAEASVHAEVSAGRRLTRLETSPEEAGAGQLLGLSVSAGFRAALAGALPSHRADQTPLYLLLDDLPVAALISGYAALYRGQSPSARAGEGQPQSVAPRVDVCSGWRRGGAMMTAIARNGRVPVPMGPVAPPLEPAHDPDAWHEIPPLAAGAMRRRRLVDLASTDPFGVHAMFRDTHVGEDGVETVLHEYSVEMRVDPGSRRVLDCEALPRVLPWPECPHAAASAHRLEGHSVAQIRSVVREEFRGTTTCTHLNDLLRSLGDIGTMAETLTSELRAN